MIHFLAWLENSMLGHAMRHSGVWTYGVVNLGHILGVATLFGAVLVLDLRLLGLWRTVPLSSIAGPTVPVATTGFVVAALTGVGLLATKATEYAGNPFLLIKFPAIAVALLNVAVVTSRPAWKQMARPDPTPGERRVLAIGGAVSLAAWLTAIGAGRMIGYW
ncbi:MAG TPA: DUF6644 family protein [Vicinamibacterales bacterium]|nr:DUF6644 family protein [Vicinamibacterales bacterium]